MLHGAVHEAVAVPRRAEQPPKRALLRRKLGLGSLHEKLRTSVLVLAFGLFGPCGFQERFSAIVTPERALLRCELGLGSVFVIAFGLFCPRGFQERFKAIVTPERALLRCELGHQMALFWRCDLFCRYLLASH